MKPFIVVGDKTSHGGVVVEGSPTNDIEGKGIARVGDKVTCPKKGCHSPTTIVSSGDVTITVDGKPVALHGDKTACGATLISSQFNTNSDPEGGGDSGGAAASSAASLAGAVMSQSAANDAKYDEQVRITNHDGEPMQNVPYHITDEAGKTYKGLTDKDGRCTRVYTDRAHELKILVGVLALEKW
ncbi:MAG: PAAR domain-containing protein [Burkholderiaceae bacterium]